MKSTTPLVTLITPTYRAEKYIAHYLQSVLMQEYNAIEFILINDGSDDNSAKIIQEFLPKLKEKCAKVHYLEKEHAGQAQAFNAALPLMTGQYLTWADSDDILHPQNISLKVAYMQEHAHCCMLRSNAMEFDQERTFLPGGYKNTAKLADKQCINIFEKLFTHSTYCLAGCYMIKTSLFRECYPTMHIPDSIVGQNLQLLLPPASRTPCHYLDKILLSYRRHSSSHFHSQLQCNAKKAARMKALLTLLADILPYCHCDQEYFTSLICAQKKSFYDSFHHKLRIARQKKGSPL